MNQPIQTPSDYQGALRAVELLMSAEIGSAEGGRLDALVTLIEAYEQQHFPVNLPASGPMLEGNS